MRIGKMDFAKRLRLRAGCAVACLCIGLGVIIVSVVANGFDPYRHAFLLGLGTGLTGAGAVKLRQTLHVLRDPGKSRATRIEEEDERNRSIEMRSSQITFYIGAIALSIASVITAFYDQKVMHTLSIVLLLLLALKGISLLVLRRLG